jgi:hypothetical protein
MDHILEEKLREQFKITPDLLGDGLIGGYLELGSERSRLDGLFSSNELHRIAEAMDETVKLKSKKDIK